MEDRGILRNSSLSTPLRVYRPERVVREHLMTSITIAGRSMRQKHGFEGCSSYSPHPDDRAAAALVTCDAVSSHNTSFTSDSLFNLLYRV